MYWLELNYVSWHILKPFIWCVFVFDTMDDRGASQRIEYHVKDIFFFSPAKTTLTMSLAQEWFDIRNVTAVASFLKTFLVSSLMAAIICVGCVFSSQPSMNML